MAENLQEYFFVNLIIFSFIYRPEYNFFQA